MKNYRQKTITLILACGLVLTLIFSGKPQTAHASCGDNQYEVANTTQLNNAIKSFNEGGRGCIHTIHFLEHIILNKPLEPINRGAKLFINGNHRELNGDEVNKLFYVHVGTVTINELDIRGGKDTGLWLTGPSTVTVKNSFIRVNGSHGAQVVSQGATLNIENSDIIANGGDGIRVDGRGGSVYVTKSVVDANLGNGIYRENDGQLRVTQSLITNNGVNGVRARNGFTIVRSSTIAKNGEDGLANGGNQDSGLRLLNSTVAQNGRHGIRREKGALEVVNSTLTANTEHGINIIANDDVAIHNSILYDNGNLDCHRRNGSSASVTTTYSIVGVYERCGGQSFAANNNSSANPKLGSYGQDGALETEIGIPGDRILKLPEVYPLATDSPAIGAGNDAKTNEKNLTEDGRGELRLVGTVDMGAYEMQASELSGTAVSSPTNNLALILILGGVLLLGMVGIVVRQRRA